MTAKNFTPATTLSHGDIRLEPLTLAHSAELAQAVQDGELWKLTVTSAPEPENAAAYIEKALNTSNRQAFAVYRDNHLIGTTSYHDINPEAKRVEIGYTFYGQSHWRSHVNTTCKYLLLCYAFDTLDCETVGWRTDILNTRSQAAIERLGAKKDGVIRGHTIRRDGSIRDTVFYSIIRDEWATIKKLLILKLDLN